jgi:glycerol-3-phosphate dehydrogenase (NAD(P)+)
MPPHSGSDHPAIGIVGLTAWGLGLALTYARAGNNVLLLARESGEADELGERRSHRRLPGATLPDGVCVSVPERSRARELTALILAVPSQQMRENLRRLAPLLGRETAIVSAAKGLELETRLRMTQVIEEELNPGFSPAALSGPNLVPEIVAGLPAAAVLASEDPAVAARLQALLSTPRLRLYTSPDVAGVEIGGSLKNVIALAAGMCEGLGYGNNATAALITRGLAEIVRLGVCMGAEAQTFSGLSGLGDLMATCSSPLSRNHRAGKLLAEGLSVGEVERGIGEVVEGISTTAAAYELSREHCVDMPITEQLYCVLYRQLSPRKAALALLDRALTPELRS